MAHPCGGDCSGHPFAHERLFAAQWSCLHPAHAKPQAQEETEEAVVNPALHANNTRSCVWFARGTMPVSVMIDEGMPRRPYARSIVFVVGQRVGFDGAQGLRDVAALDQRHQHLDAEIQARLGEKHMLGRRGSRLK